MIDNSSNNNNKIDKGGNNNKNNIASISDLSNSNKKHRTICIITTASLPWRTGTSINPLARALYLLRLNHRVVLYIPWLEDGRDQLSLFNQKFITQQEQIQWIKQYCIDRIHCTEVEAEKLHIQFYPSKYNSSFGSIFPTTDILSLIPSEDCDVAILEEPEHLNWFRYIPTTTETSSSNEESTSDNNKEHDTTTASTTSSTNISANNSKNNEKQQQESSSDNKNEKEKADEVEEDDNDILQLLGWKQKFNYVIGIIHTNYSAYLNQYSIGPGTAFVTSTALTALSSLVVKAYCHRIIRLSDTLPTLDQSREITCNVHGVRSEFLLSPNVESNNNHDNNNEKNNTKKVSSSSSCSSNFSSIYFIGKLTWAKGFDKCLELQDLYRSKNGKFFDIDIYGSGNDVDAIKRSFFGRNNRPGLQHQQQQQSNDDDDDENINNNSLQQKDENDDDEIASLVFSKTSSLKDLLVESQQQNQNNNNNNNDQSNNNNDFCYHRNNSTSRKGIDDLPDLFSVLGDAGGRTINAGVETTEASKRLGGKLLDIGFHATFLEEEEEEVTEETTTTTTTASNVSSSSSSNKSNARGEERNGDKTTTKKTYHFSPVQTKFELRKEAIPARFLGVKDHAALRDITAHNIFLNMSETEVLCTTTAEALAMGKFVIIPVHPSNEFFLQFSNCLGFTSQEECVEKIQWALENEPKPLSKDESHTLSWEGAVERLIESSAVTEDFLQEMVDSGEEESSRQAAKIHIEAMRKGHAAMKLLNRS